ncbi:MAG TPA: hypothetical protein VLA48_09545 [Nitrososphaeraceae archaeon]|nr:hypothetical protein [Nitrososphaeraceae archaeon]
MLIVKVHAKSEQMIVPVKEVPDSIYDSQKIVFEPVNETSSKS